MKKLKPEYQELADEFAADADDFSCACHINPPCGRCIHPGNPDNLAENEDAWEEEL